MVLFGPYKCCLLLLSAFFLKLTKPPLLESVFPVPKCSVTVFHGKDPNESPVNGKEMSVCLFHCISLYP